MKSTILENWKRRYTKLQYDISYTKLIVPVVAELTARRIPSLCKKTSTGAGKQQRGSLMILVVQPCWKKTILHCGHAGSATRRGALLSRYFARLLLAVQLSSLEIAVFVLVMDIYHGGDTRYRRLSRAATYEKAPRRNNWWRARAMVTADQIFTTPTSLDVYNFRANGAARDASRRVIRIERARVRQVIPLHSPPPVWFREYFSP